MRIVHLAYEDPQQPGSGGGSVRVAEIVRRLSSRHSITVLTTGYPGGGARQEDGVRWIPIGSRSPRITFNRLTYMNLAGPLLRRYPHDLVVEEFGPPYSTCFSPLFTRKPVVASVQWLFAREMREKYHLPFDLVEGLGLRLYHDFIAVSDWLADVVRARRPGATVETIANGVDPQAFRTTATSPRSLVFLGRLDRYQKGGDLLIDIVARLKGLLGENMPPLLIAGDGPDEAQIRLHATRLGLDKTVLFVGRVEGEQKYELLSSAYAVLMPSRWESFGIVAIEAQAVGVPVVAFDIGPLRSVITGGIVVKPFDVDAYATSVASLVTDEQSRTTLGQAGRAKAASFDWDAISLAQEAHYLRAIAPRPAALPADRSRMHR